MTNCEIDDACRMLHPSPASPNHFITYLPKNCRPNPNVLLALSHKYVHNRSSIKIIPSTNKYLLYLIVYLETDFVYPQQSTMYQWRWYLINVDYNELILLLQFDQYLFIK